MTTMDAKIYNKFLTKLEEQKNDVRFMKNIKKGLIDLLREVKLEEKINKPPKILSEYNIFMSEKLKEFIKENPEENAKDRFKRAAAVWSSKPKTPKVTKVTKGTKVTKIDPPKKADDDDDDSGGNADGDDVDSNKKADDDDNSGGDDSGGNIIGRDDEEEEEDDDE